MMYVLHESQTSHVHEPQASNDRDNRSVAYGAAVHEFERVAGLANSACTEYFSF